MRCMGGVLQARLAPTDDLERQKAIDAGHDLDRILSTEDLVAGENVFFTATGVTDGDLLRGVRFSSGGAHTQSIVMRAKSGTVRVIEAYHRLDKLREYATSSSPATPTHRRRCHKPTPRQVDPTRAPKKTQKTSKKDIGHRPAPVESS